MKTKLYFLIVAGALAFLAPKANAQALIQFWDFNATLPSGGTGGDSLGNVTNTLVANQVANGLTAGHIIFSRPRKKFGSLGIYDSTLDNGAGGAFYYDKTTTNDSSGGNLFVRARNPCDSNCLYINIPTTGFKNIMFDFALSASSTKGANYGLFAYSTNGGTSWSNLTTAMDTFNISSVKRPDTLQLQNPTTSISSWYPVQTDFTSDASVNNNASFVIRIMLAGPNTNQQGSGNTRFDNFAVWGKSISGAGVSNISDLGGYSIYPNPASSFVNVVSHYMGDKTVTLYNSLGQAITIIQNHDIETTINTSKLTSGIYIVEIKEVNTGNKYTQKVVVQ